MTPTDPIQLQDLTTTRIGGPAGRFRRAESAQQIIDAIREADEQGRSVLLVGGGSNLLVGDSGFDGDVVQIASRGIQATPAPDGAGTTVTVRAGHPWDETVAWTVEQGLSGLEALSGIPGTTGATPVQNVGAYGAEVSHTISQVRVWDRRTGSRTAFSAEDLAFAYRDSLLKRTTVDGSPRYVVLEVDFLLPSGPDSAPIRYAQLAAALGRQAGERAPLQEVRDTVLALRASKGMVLDPQDPDTFSTGSFFTNPIVEAAEAQRLLPAEAPRFPVVDAAGQEIPGRVKLSAAWLIDHAGFGKGFGLPGTRNEQLGLDGEQAVGGRAAVSTKHTLAMTNRGTASSSEVEQLARTVRDGVLSVHGIELVPEPVMVGFGL